MSRLHNKALEPCKIGSLISKARSYDIPALPFTRQSEKHNTMKVFISFLNNLNKTLAFKTLPPALLRQAVHCIIDETVVRMKQSVTIIHLESLKCFLVCCEEPIYLNTLHVLHCKHHFVGEQEILF